MYIAGPCYVYTYKPPGTLMYIAGTCCMHTYKPPGKLMYIAGPCYGYRYKPPGKLMYIAGSCYVPIYTLARYIAVFPYVHSRSSGRWARPQVRGSAGVGGCHRGSECP